MISYRLSVSLFCVCLFMYYFACKWWSFHVMAWGLLSAGSTLPFCATGICWRWGFAGSRLENGWRELTRNLLPLTFLKNGAGRWCPRLSRYWQTSSTWRDCLLRPKMSHEIWKTSCMNFRKTLCCVYLSKSAISAQSILLRCCQRDPYETMLYHVVKRTKDIHYPLMNETGFLCGGEPTGTAAAVALCVLQAPEGSGWKCREVVGARGSREFDSASHECCGISSHASSPTTPRFPGKWIPWRWRHLSELQLSEMCNFDGGHSTTAIKVPDMPLKQQDKVLGKSWDRQCFFDWHILCVVQEF